MRSYARSVAAFVAALSLTASFGLSGTSALASSGGTGSPTGLKDGGVSPSDPSPAASWTLSQSQTYANKLPGLSRVSSAFGTQVSHPYTPMGLAQATGTTTSLCPSTPTRTPTTAQCGPPATKWISIYNDPEPNSYYGYQCGPAAGHNALGAYGVNYPVGTGYYPYATYLTQEMHTKSNGTLHDWMPGSLNSHESRNVYAWQTLGTPAGSTNGTTDLLNYTVTDIWYNDSPIYNIETYGQDPLHQNVWRYPFSQYNGVDIGHYIAAYGYYSSGQNISISDSAVLYSHTAAQRYDQYYQDVWAAIHNNPNLDAILW